MADQLGRELPNHVRAEEWEPVLRSALQSLFPVSVECTGGPQERGADIEIVIPNPFNEDQPWIVPVQVKDHEDEVSPRVADQLHEAFKSRSRDGQVIAVVLLVSKADQSKGLKERMHGLERECGVPFVYCRREQFLKILTRGYLRQSLAEAGADRDRRQVGKLNRGFRPSQRPQCGGQGKGELPEKPGQHSMRR